MKNFIGYCALPVLAAICFSCNNSGQTNSVDAAKDSNAAKIDSQSKSGQPASSVPVGVSKEDSKFLVDAASANMMEVELGKLAQEKAVAKDVKDYGAMMVKDHSAAGEKVKMLANGKNITLPADLAPDQQKVTDDLKAKSGKAFDNAYINQMIDDHKKVIKAFEDESKNGSDADIRSFADNTLHTLRTHLDAAESCHKMMKKM